MENIIRQTLVAWFCDRAKASTIVEFELSQNLAFEKEQLKIGNETSQLKLFKFFSTFQTSGDSWH